MPFAFPAESVFTFAGIPSQAAQGSLVHNDDTSMRILSYEREAGDARTGMFTPGIVSVGARAGPPAEPD